jgi:hypothetical protein
VKDIERKHYLPVTREVARPTRHYHSQLGWSLEARERVTPKPHLNSSARMQATIQCEGRPQLRLAGSLDDFKYNSRK